MIQNISFCGARNPFIGNEKLVNVTTGLFAKTMNDAVETASKTIGREIKTPTGKKYTGVMVKDANYHLFKNGRLTEEGAKAVDKMHNLNGNLTLGALKKSLISKAAENIYAESDKGPAMLTWDLKYLG